jgi:dihydroflavonol-4-reductase
MSKTIVLTGITGFIAKRIALDLLQAGYSVRGSLRSQSRADEVRDALRPRLSDPAAFDRLSFVELDLGRDDGWTEAMEGADALVHTASLPHVRTEGRERRHPPRRRRHPARAARHAGGGRDTRRPDLLGRRDRSQGQARCLHRGRLVRHRSSQVHAYYKSKTLAERAAWDFAADHPEIQLTTINPALVLGEPMDRHYGTSLALIGRILAGKDPMVPDIGFGIVDVADISAMHLAALDRPESIGHRFIGSNGTMTMPQIAQHLAARFPDRRIATRIAPKFLLRLILSLFDTRYPESIGLGACDLRQHQGARGAGHRLHRAARGHRQGG